MKNSYFHQNIREESKYPIIKFNSSISQSVEDWEGSIRIKQRIQKIYLWQPHTLAPEYLMIYSDLPLEYPYEREKSHVSDFIMNWI